MPLDARVKPDAESIDRHVDHLQDLWSEAHSVWRETDTYIHRTFEVFPAALNRKGYHPAQSKAILDHAADTQMSFAPIVHRPPAGTGDIHKQRADRVEPAVKAILDDCSLLEPVLPYKAAGKNLLAYGYTNMMGPVLDLRNRMSRPRRKRGQTVEDFQYQESMYEAATHGWNPYRLHVCSPDEVLMDPMDKIPAIAVRTRSWWAYELEYLSIEKSKQRRGVSYAMPYSMGDKDPYESIDAYDVWSAWYHCVKLKNGEILWIENNAWGFQPFSHCFSGYGQLPTGQKFNPKYWAEGILDPVKESLKLGAQEATAKHSALMRAAYAKPGTRLDAAEAAQRMGDDIIQGEAGDFWIEQTPQLPAWLFQTGIELQSDIEQGTFSRQVSGFREQGVSTVGQQAILSTAASRKFAGVNEQMNSLASIGASNLLRLAEKLDTPVRMGEHKLDPKDIEGNYRISIEFKYIDPVLRLQESEFAMRERMARLISDEDYWSVSGKEDASGIRKRILKDEIRQMPEVKEYMQGLVMREMGLEEIVSRAAAEAQARLQGPAGMGGALTEQPQNGTRPDVPAVAARQMNQALTPDTYRPDQGRQGL